MKTPGQAGACERCGAIIPRKGLDQLCPACLLESLLMADPPTTTESNTHTATSGGESERVPLLKSFGDYELVEQVGFGGMGVVYRARHRRLNRTVALKLVRSPGVDHRSFSDRFQLEARAAAALDHPDIVSVFEHGEVEGQAYIAMRFVEGHSLDWQFSRGRMPIQKAVALLIRLAHAVHYAHQRGVLHRDLKPGNVLLDREGRPHLTDFGLARFMEGSESMTRTTLSLGTPSYMSPEVARGDSSAVTTAADVYGLGTILYEALTGCPPFTGEKTYEVLRNVIEQEPVKPSWVVGEVPKDLDTICMKAMAKKPADRYGSALEFAQDLQRWLDCEPILAQPPTRRERIIKWCQREPLKAAIVGLLMVGFSLFVWERTASNARLKQERDTSRREQLRAEAVSTRLLIEEGDRRLENGAAMDALAIFAHLLRQSPSNEVAASRIVSLLSHRNFSLPIAVPITSTGSLVAAEFLPSGNRLMVAERNGRIRICDWRAGGAEGWEVTHGGECLEARVSRDGRRLASAGFDGWIHVWDLAKRKSIRSIQVEGDALRTVDLSPDGTEVAAGGALQTLRVWAVDSGKLLRSQKHDGTVTRVRFHPHGRAVASASSDGTVRMMEWSGPFPTTRVRRMTSEQFALDWDPTGRRLATQEAGYERISILDAETLEVKVGPMHHDGVLSGIAFSSDGLKVAGASEDHAARIWDAITGQAVTELLPHPDVVVSASFSPDGKHLVTACLDGAARVWDVRDGRTRELRLEHPKALQHIEVSPDGQTIATLALDWKLRAFDLTTGKLRFPEVEHPDPLHSVYFSPDSQRLVVVDGARVSSRLSVREGRSVRIYDARNGQLALPALNFELRPSSVQFFRNGSRILVGCQNGETSLWDISGSTARLISKIPGAGKGVIEPVYSLRLSPDEQRVVLAFGDGRAEVWNLSSLTQPRFEMRVRQTRGTRWAEFSPGGETILTCSDDHHAYLWRLGEPQSPQRVFRHDQIVHGGHFDSSGDRVVTFSVDRTARIWDVKTGNLLVPTLKHSDQVWSAYFSKDDRRVVTATWQGSLRVWDAATGLPLTESLGGNIPQRPYVEQPDIARMTPDGQRVACMSSDHSVRLVDVPTFSMRSPEWLPDLAEAVAGRYLDPQQGPRKPAMNRTLELRDRLLQSSGNDTEIWGRWGRWFFEDREKRSASAFRE